ncbi:MAG TPA: DUF4956 domain-containing protein [Vicinamibacteria bacterium]|nr:DUF4956 domain-containing protein [Vicinamibacteria bacterium]
MLLALSLGGAMYLIARLPRGVFLVDLAAEARLHAPNGAYAVFSDSRELRSEITLSGDTRRSLTPPFPSELTFDVHLPPGATLELSTALVMMQEVRRAHVSFSVDVRVRGETVTVLAEDRTVAEANRWYAARVDLARFGGNDVSITLRAFPSRGRDDTLWSSRVRAVWGEPRVGVTPGALAEVDRTLHSILERATSGQEGAARIGQSDFLIGLVLAGVLALVPLGRFRAMPVETAVLFALAATLMFKVVHSSVALALGLLGALSIIRFRSPVRTGEQLVHLLFLVALGLSIGTGQHSIAITGAFACLLLGAVASLGARRATRCYRLVASARDADAFEERARQVVAPRTFESRELKDGIVALTANLELLGSQEFSSLMSRVFEQIPHARVSIRSVEEALSGP